MKADGPILAEGERAPGWWARYRFYFAGKVPRGHEDWALRRMSLGRWVAFYLALDLVAWTAAMATSALVTREVDFPGPLWFAWVLVVVLAPVTAVRRRNQAARSLAPPPADEVLRDIREPVPPRP
ncbi:MAG TPA: hypothetical protein VEV43_11570 [Actinomycetota bacterium]|nr:hypothetical protein [Actinomycetota bacterium]